MNVFRPADINETLECWEASLNNEKGPSAIILSRQKLNYVSKSPDKNNRCIKGAYELNISSHDNKVTIIASGSEVGLALSTQELLKEVNVESKVVSMPCQELFDKQSEEYKNKIIEKESLIVSVEAGTVSCWHKYLKKDDVAIGIDEFGKSAPYKEIYEEMNLTANKIASLIQKIKKLNTYKFMEKIRSFSDSLDIKNKRVILRSDFNVPILKEIIQDKTRIDLSIPFIQNLLKKNAKGFNNFSFRKTKK